MHGGGHFDVLVAENDEIALCLHPWEQEEHPTMTNSSITRGNGLILYFRTDHMRAIRQNVEKLGWPVEEDVHLNLNSSKLEFSVRDPDGYYLTITDFHRYEG